ncbi:pentatricopeptide repeat-containing protein At3g12770-like [Phragmites australis]|uniref:pentatricopeptide repeat-containing protein At3g12770-like n=1 Tax=Phragmites australis TaxID=29695 RepID=UPI002D7A09DC|nr:pentatricopeptide repeat-containing protein At3g12770-like [Phragmites australis]
MPPSGLSALPPTAAVRHYTRLLAAAASSSTASLRVLLPIHARAVILSISVNPAFATSLLAAAAPASLAYARRVFDAAPLRDAYMWNTLLRAHAHHQSSAADTLALYKRMRASGIAPDHYTYPIVLPACAAARALWLGRAAHGDAVRFALAGDGFVRSALIAMYCQVGEMADAERVFAESGGDGSRTVVSWTAMVAGYAQNCFFGEAVALFGTMVAEGVLPNEITLISFLPCLQGQEWVAAGEMVHGFVLKLGFDANIPLVNALIAMYGKCGSMAMAEALFDGMTTRSLVSWNTMVAMYEQHGDTVEAIKFFRRMLTEKVGFDCVTLVSVLSACARSGALETGKWVHEFARSHGLDTDARIGNVLVDMYAKCGEIAYAREVFDCLRGRGVVSWSAMISAYANHGEPEEALKLFSLMKCEEVRPNSFTFTAVLMACGHSGLVDEGLKHFNSILTDYQMSPTLEHYACMVDMLGRAGRLVEAYEIIRGMSVRPDKCVWGAFLGGCRLHGNLELAEFVAKDLFQSGSNDVTFYVLMSNMYFEAGLLEDAERMRKAMKEMELKKTAGRSLVCTNRERRAFMR